MSRKRSVGAKDSSAPINKAISDSIASAMNAVQAPVSKFAVHRWDSPSYCVASTIMSEKMQEVERQIERIRPYLTWAETDDDADVDLDSLNYGISLLRFFANTPSPIPMLAMSNDGKPTLYMRDGLRTLEATLDEGKLEYLFTLGDQDTFFEDEFRSDQVPGNLMYLLFSNFAKNEKVAEAE